MTKLRKKELVQQVNMNAREYGISTVLFRHAVGDLLGVNVTDMECLALIFFKGLARPSELARYSGLTSGATTAMLDRLEKARLIERRPNPHDRRGTLITPTQERNQELNAIFTPVRDSIDKLTASYSEKELELIADYLKKVAAIWEAERNKLPKRD
jgi:DNA-binding MarR family transcriptional regulator